MLNLFYRILGTNRSPYILALPFMYLGASYAKTNNYITISQCQIPIFVFFLWCLEVIVIQLKTGNYNIFMTLTGAVFIVSTFSYLENNYVSFVNNRYVVLSLFLFSIQYSTTLMCFTMFNLSTLPLRITFFILYALFITTIFLIYNRRNDVQKNI